MHFYKVFFITFATIVPSRIRYKSRCERSSESETVNTRRIKLGANEEEENKDREKDQRTKNSRGMKGGRRDSGSEVNEVEGK